MHAAGVPKLRQPRFGGLRRRVRPRLEDAARDVQGAGDAAVLLQLGRLAHVEDQVAFSRRLLRLLGRDRGDAAAGFGDEVFHGQGHR